MLDPEGQLDPAVAVEVAQDLVVVHATARGIDLATRPRRPRFVMRTGVLPPVDLGAGVILAEDDVEIAVAIQVAGGPAGLDVEPAIDRVDRPAILLAPIPGEARPFDPAGDHDVVPAVLVNVEHQAGRLLGQRAGRRQVARLAREIGPGRSFSRIRPHRAQEQERHRDRNKSLPIRSHVRDFR